MSRRLLLFSQIHQRAAGFTTKSSGKRSKPTSSFTPLALLGTIALLGPGYYLLKPLQPLEKTVASAYPAVKKNDKLQIKGLPHVKYVLVGAGTASAAALEAIREVDPFAQVLIISAEAYTPYQRPPLSKELLWPEKATTLKKGSADITFMNWQQKETSLFYLPLESYSFVDRKDLNKTLSKDLSKVHILLGTYVEAIDADKHTLVLDDKQVISFDKVLIATGGQPFVPPCFRDLQPDVKNRVMTYRSLDDFKRLDQMIEKVKKVAIVGGGFLGMFIILLLVFLTVPFILGTELSYSLKKKKPTLEITQLFPEEGNLSLVLPSYLTKWTTKKLANEGVLVKPKQEVVQVARSTKEGGVDLLLKSGEVVEADLVILSTGLVPSVSLAKRSDLEIDPKLNGIVGKTYM